MFLNHPRAVGFSVFIPPRGSLHPSDLYCRVRFGCTV